MKKIFLGFLFALVSIQIGWADGMSTSTTTTMDTEITTQAKSALTAAKETRGVSIGINTQNGIVTLTGFVAQQSQKDKAEKIVQDLGGVKKVIDNIVIRK